jgi:hypothetical protein
VCIYETRQDRKVLALEALEVRMIPLEVAGWADGDDPVAIDGNGRAITDAALIVAGDYEGIGDQQAHDASARSASTEMTPPPLFIRWGFRFEVTEITLMFAHFAGYRTTRGATMCNPFRRHE